MEGHQIVNYDMSANKNDLATLRWTMQATNNPPHDGEIWIELPMLMFAVQLVLFRQCCSQ